MHSCVLITHWFNLQIINLQNQKPSFLAKFLTRVAFKPLPWPEQPIPDPDTSDLVAFGKYLTTAKFDCFSCHSADFQTVDIMNPEQSEGYFGGGNPLLDLEGNTVLSSNLTMDRETGLGEWSEEEFIKCVKTGIRPHGKPAFQYPMMPHTQLYDREVSAIWAYLKTVPVIHNEKTGGSKSLGYPRPTKGILVAITVINNTLADNGKLAI